MFSNYIKIFLRDSYSFAYRINSLCMLWKFQTFKINLKFDYLFYDLMIHKLKNTHKIQIKSRYFYIV